MNRVFNRLEKKEKNRMFSKRNALMSLFISGESGQRTVRNFYRRHKRLARCWECGMQTGGVNYISNPPTLTSILISLLIECHAQHKHTMAKNRSYTVVSKTKREATSLQCTLHTLFGDDAIQRDKLCSVCRAKIPLLLLINETLCKQIVRWMAANNRTRWWSALGR